MHQQILDALADGSALFFRALSDRLGGDRRPPPSARRCGTFVWSGYLTNDTLGPVSAPPGSGPRHDPPRPRVRPETPPEPLRQRRSGSPGDAEPHGPPDLVGRWSTLPSRETSTTKRALATSEVLLDRYGVVTRGSVMAERIPGGFAAVYPF